MKFFTVESPIESLAKASDSQNSFIFFVTLTVIIGAIFIFYAAIRFLKNERSASKNQERMEKFVSLSLESLNKINTFIVQSEARMNESHMRVIEYIKQSQQQYVDLLKNSEENMKRTLNLDHKDQNLRVENMSGILTEVRKQVEKTKSSTEDTGRKVDNLLSKIDKN